MIKRLLLCILLLSSVSVNSSEREYKGVSWRAEVYDFVATLSWAPTSAINVCFEQVPSELVSIKLNAPYLLRETIEASLYLMDSPIAEEGDRFLLQSLSRRQLQGQNAKEVRFTKSVDNLINRMAAGAWAVVELKTRSGVVHTVELPSIGFNHSFEQFNVLRNQLPPMSWAAAQEVNTYFSPGSISLSQAQKVKLNNLAEYLQKDSSVIEITIDAHTDVEGDRLDNLTLSKQRAAEVKDYFAQDRSG